MTAAPKPELHPLCTLFPRLVGAEFDALRDDIKANGLRQAIVLHDGMILDGGNRYRACLEAGVPPVFADFSGDSIVAFVLSSNLHRRHMSAGQQAAIVASARVWASAHGHGGHRRGDQAATLPLEKVADRAAQSGASERTQRMADKVARVAPQLAQAVAQGEMSLPKAHREATRRPPPSRRQVKQGEAPQAEEESHDDIDLVAELEAAHKQIEALAADLNAATAIDAAAESVKWRRIAEQAQDRQAVLMGQLNDRERELKYQAKLLQRIGKLFGERDASKVPALVEAFFRQHAREAA